jgi:hypothetical protein
MDFYYMKGHDGQPVTVSRNIRHGGPIQPRMLHRFPIGTRDHYGFADSNYTLCGRGRPVYVTDTPSGQPVCEHCLRVLTRYYVEA